MNRLNMKRIAVLAGALLVGAAIAGPVSFNNIPIINSAGQPVVQIVVGSQAKPSDGVVAANIAAVIGNLAYTTQTVTATVQGTSALKCVPASTASCTITNQKVWLGESGIAAPSGSYAFAGLIGSVLNRADKLGVPQYSKNLVSAAGSQYAYPVSNSITSSPAASPYYGTTVPISVGVTANYNGGGVSFTGFGGSSTAGEENILRVTPAEVPSLVSNFGPGQESEYLWVTGFPVYDQNAKNFALLDAGGALQLVFSKPIPLYGSSGPGSFNNAEINIAGQNWTIIGGMPANVEVSSSTNFVQGGNLTLAQSMTNLTTVYVGHNITSGPFTVQLADLGQPNANGISPAALNIYYNGKLTNTSSIFPPGYAKFNVSGQTLYVKVNQTFAGLYAYEKWAKIQLFSNEYNIYNGKQYNKTTNPGWNVFLDWVNTSGSGSANALESIVIYNVSPVQALLPGQSFDFLTNPAKWKLTFVGETLPTGNFDALTISTSYAASKQYENLGTGVTGAPAPKNITEPAQLLTVTSTIPGAFTYMGTTNSTVVYDLTPYALYESHSAAGINSLLTSVPVNLIITGTEGEYIGQSGNPSLTVTVSGYASSTATAATSNSVTFSSESQSLFAGSFYNITNIGLSQALPGVTVSANAILPSVFSGNVPYVSNSVYATNVPAIGSSAGTGTTNAIWIIANLVPVNEITFSGSTANDGYVPFVGNVEITSNGIAVNTLTPNSIMVLNGNVEFSGSLPLIYDNSYDIGNVLLSANVTISNTIGYSNTMQIANTIPVSGNLFVSTTAPISGNLVLSGNIVIEAYLTSNSGGAGYNTPTENAIIVTPPTNLIVSAGSAVSDPLLAYLTAPSHAAAAIFYPVSGYSYPWVDTNYQTVTYNQGNGQPAASFTLNALPVVTGTGAQAYFSYSLQEFPVPANSTANDLLSFDIVNSTGGASAALTNLFQLNYSATTSNTPGTHNNMTYTSTTGASFNVQQGFRTEKGSEVASISPTSLTVDLAKNIDMLEFTVGPVNATTTTAQRVVGPFGVGQATNLPNVTIAKVTANCTITSTTGTNCTIEGISNLTAVPTVTQAITPVRLNTAATPLVVLDTQANPQSTLIVIGSKYVNSIAAQIFAQNPSLNSAFGPTGPDSVIVQSFGNNRILVAGYYANQTVEAGNEFIQDLLAAASS